MSEERDVVNREILGGGETKSCALCEIPKPKSSLIMVSSEVIGHSGGGQVDICSDCYRTLQQGDIEPPGDPEF